MRQARKETVVKVKIYEYAEVSLDENRQVVTRKEVFERKLTREELAEKRAGDNICGYVFLGKSEMSFDCDVSATNNDEEDNNNG